MISEQIYSLVKNPDKCALITGCVCVCCGLQEKEGDDGKEETRGLSNGETAQ